MADGRSRPIKSIYSRAIRSLALAFIGFIGAVLAVAGVAMTSSCTSPSASRLTESTPLDTYVHRPDPAYRWEIVSRHADPSGTTYVLDLRSQVWLSTAHVDRVEWQHWLTIYKPDEVTSETALLFIGGGKNGQPPPESMREHLKSIAEHTNSVAIELRMVPNQPLIFKGGEQRGRTEDDLIAFAWIKYIQTGNPLWLPRLPMVKSAVRAMDAATECLANDALTLRKFVVTGGSKRGWTTWLTGVVDRRVVAIIPMVIDVLNVDVSMRHHYAAYGGWALAVHDYVDHGVMNHIETPAMASLLGLVDPYAYRHRLTMPKFIINASGDQFFLPDSSRFYWSGLRGEDNYMRYVENADHSLGGSDAFESLLAFYHSIVTDTPRPRFSWTIQPDGSIEVRTQSAPSEVSVWRAVNLEKRDFRIETIGKRWEKSPLVATEPGVYTARELKPPSGWKAFFVELIYEQDGPAPFKFSTGVSVIPDVMPHQWGE